MRKSLVLGLISALIASVLVVAAPSVQSATAESFDPGQIIIDDLFYDQDAMSAGQIQSFLDSKIGTCLNGRCLNVAVVPVADRPAERSSSTGMSICSALQGGNLRVSELIYRIQAACGISAKVILVTLHKEQGLVTSRAPGDWALLAAMGMACPDTAACNSAYAGLATQIVTGTRQLKVYKAAAFARQPGVHFIQYHPNAGCGGTNVNIRNYATAALYNYTPYQPNAASLANPGAGGDACSSYGNRNFWNYYTDWFGSTSGNTISSVDRTSHVLARDGSGTLWAYAADGEGWWRKPASLGSGWEGFRDVFGVGDADGDGFRDVIAVMPAGTAWLYPGDGGLGFRPRKQINVDWSAESHITPAADFSGDRIPDVFTLNGDGDLVLWRGDGEGQFIAPVVVGWGWGSMELLISAGDFDGDARADVISRATDGTLYVYLGNGSSAWKGSRQIGWGWGSMVALAVPGDFNGDGLSDLLAFDDSGRAWAYGRSGLGLRGLGQVGNGWQGMNIIEGPGMLPGPKRVHQPGAGDLNRDGHRDVLTVDAKGQLLAYYGNGSSGWAGSAVVESGFGADSRLLDLGDFDSDGRQDVGVIGSDGTFSLRPRDSTGGFGDSVEIGWGWKFDTVIGGLDFDGDGKLDVLARNAVGDLVLYPGDGVGGFKGSRMVGFNWGAMTAILNAGDFDGDGFVDVIARDSTGTLRIYPTNGAGGWRPARVIGTGWGGMDTIFSPGNFDRSGGNDLIARSSTGTLYLYRGNGAGSWSGAQEIGWGWGTMSWIG